MKEYFEYYWRELSILGLLVTLALMTILMGGCSNKAVKFVEKTDTVKVKTIEYKTRDTIIYQEADSSESMWLIDCEGENARLKQIIAYKPGNHIQPATVYLKDNKLTVKCKEDSLRMEIELRDTKITELSKVTTQIILPAERYIPKFYKFTFWLFWVFVVITLGWVAIKVLKLKIPFKI